MRRGYGTALTLAAMRGGLEAGLRTAALESSEMGLAVYSRLGFKTIGEVKVFYIPPAEAE